MVPPLDSESDSDSDPDHDRSRGPPDGVRPDDEAPSDGSGPGAAAGAGGGAGTDGGRPVAFTESELSALVRDAVVDGVLYAVGTILLVVLGVGLAGTGVLLAVNSLNTVGLVVGAGVAATGLYVAGAALGYLPSPGDLR
jgi:hypothetical protein